MSENAPAGKSSLAEKLDELFRKMRAEQGREYTYEEVAEGIRQGGGTISASYIWMLRKGQQDNPSKKHLETLAAFFGVPVNYFFDDEAAARIDAQLELVNAMRDAGVRDIALLASELTPEGRRAISVMIEQVRLLQQGSHGATRANAETTEGQPGQQGELKKGGVGDA